MRRLLVLFAREPAAGRVKTRLAATLGAGRAAALYRAFVADVAGALRSDGEWEPRLAVADGVPAPELAALAPGWTLEPQPAGDLGDRMAAVFAAAGRAGFDAVAVAGSDAPLLSGEDVRRAFAAVGGGADVALAPSPDGGFALVALRRGVDAAALFAGVGWSTPRALADVRARAGALALGVALLPEVADVDVAADLDLLRAQLARDPLGARETARVLGSWGSA